MSKAVLALLLSVLGCASSAPEPAYYLLRADERAPTPSAPLAVIGLGHVTVAPYLERVGLVLRMDAIRVREAAHHLWAEPLDRGIWHYLGARLSAQLGGELGRDAAQRASWQRRVDVRIDELHGSLDGQTRLVAAWSIVDMASGDAIAEHRLVSARRQERDGYAGLVEAEMALLDELASEIARTLE